MGRRTFRVLVALSLVPACSAGCRGSGGSGRAGDPAVAATNTYLAAVARELLGAREPILVLAGPGMCPGHFDARPSQIDRLSRCRLLLRFDFQESLDAKLTRPARPGGELRIASVAVPAGLCVPAGYQAACRQAAEALTEAGLVERPAAEARLADLAGRMARLSAWATEEVRRAGLAGAAVVASGHQEAFCRSLGLEVAGTFSASDTAGVHQIDEAIRAGQAADARIVVANRPEGRRLADALAERLGAETVVLDNFPPSDGGFEDLVRGNVARLAAAGG